MQSPGAAIRSDYYKLIDYYENNTVQLFNLEKDLGEKNDISSSYPEKVLELQTILHKWRVAVNAQMMVPNSEYKSGN